MNKVALIIGGGNGIGRATFMPDVAQAVSRLPELILGYRKPPVLTSSLDFRHLISGLLALVSLNLT